jgi:hypothetical protein
VKGQGVENGWRVEGDGMDLKQGLSKDKRGKWEKQF